MSITISNCDEDKFLNAVRIDGLLKYNMEKTNDKLKIPDLEIIRVANNEKDVIVGGVSGTTFLSSLEVEVLWVHEDYRGQNLASCLLEEIENEARKAGCRLAHLTTYSFQAPRFYQKNGYDICGEIDGFPDDIRLYFLKKSL